MEPARQSSDNSVEHVNRNCSDELLRKFSDSGDEGDCGDKARLDLVVRAPKRRRKSTATSRAMRVGPGDQAGQEACDSPTHGGSLVERRSLLPAAAARRRSALLRRLGIGRSSQLRARELRNRSFLGTIEKTWRKTVEGASRVFMEKHYNRHRRLISDSAV